MLHPELYSVVFLDKWLDARFQHVRDMLAQHCTSVHIRFLRPDIFTFPLFSPRFCQLLAQELEHIERSRTDLARPNNMAYSGTILRDVGLDFCDDLVARLLQPLAASLMQMNPLGSLHAFAVAYGTGLDKALDPHVDDSTVTFNAALTSDFEGSSLLFCGNMGAPDHRHASYEHEHVRGSVICHYGHVRHSALPITAGVRRNLILWLKEDPPKDRRGPYQRENGHPDALCVSFTHDHDYFDWHQEPPLRGDGSFASAADRRAWCPPPGAAFEPAGREEQA